MRSKIVAGNWKMNKNLVETEVLLAELSAKLPDTKAEVMVAPTFVNLSAAVDKLKSSIMQKMGPTLAKYRPICCWE
jgi:triosephosphate isomerase